MLATHLHCISSVYVYGVKVSGLSVMSVVLLLLLFMCSVCVSAGARLALCAGMAG